LRQDAPGLSIQPDLISSSARSHQHSSLYALLQELLSIVSSGQRLESVPLIKLSHDISIFRTSLRTSLSIENLDWIFNFSKKLAVFLIVSSGLPDGVVFLFPILTFVELVRNLFEQVFDCALQCLRHAVLSNEFDWAFIHVEELRDVTSSGNPVFDELVPASFSNLRCEIPILNSVETVKRSLSLDQFISQEIMRGFLFDAINICSNKINSLADAGWDVTILESVCSLFEKIHQFVSHSLLVLDNHQVLECLFPLFIDLHSVAHFMVSYLLRESQNDLETTFLKFFRVISSIHPFLQSLLQKGEFLTACHAFFSCSWFFTFSSLLDPIVYSFSPETQFLKRSRYNHLFFFVDYQSTKALHTGQKASWSLDVYGKLLSDDTVFDSVFQNVLRTISFSKIPIRFLHLLSLKIRLGTSEVTFSDLIPLQARLHMLFPSASSNESSFIDKTLRLHLFTSSVSSHPSIPVIAQFLQRSYSFLVDALRMTLSNDEHESTIANSLSNSSSSYLLSIALHYEQEFVSDSSFVDFISEMFNLQLDPSFRLLLCRNILNYDFSWNLDLHPCVLFLVGLAITSRNEVHHSSSKLFGYIGNSFVNYFTEAVKFPFFLENCYFFFILSCRCDFLQKVQFCSALVKSLFRVMSSVQPLALSDDLCFFVKLVHSLLSVSSHSTYDSFDSFLDNGTLRKKIHTWQSLVSSQSLPYDSSTLKAMKRELSTHLCDAFPRLLSFLESQIHLDDECSCTCFLVLTRILSLVMDEPSYNKILCTSFSLPLDVVKIIAMVDVEFCQTQASLHRFSRAPPDFLFWAADVLAALCKTPQFNSLERILTLLLLRCLRSMFAFPDELIVRNPNNEEASAVSLVLCNVLFLLLENLNLHGSQVFIRSFRSDSTSSQCCGTTAVLLSHHLALAKVSDTFDVLGFAFHIPCDESQFVAYCTQTIVILIHEVIKMFGAHERFRLDDHQIRLIYPLFFSPSYHLRSSILPAVFSHLKVDSRDVLSLWIHDSFEALTSALQFLDSSGMGQSKGDLSVIIRVPINNLISLSLDSLGIKFIQKSCEKFGFSSLLHIVSQIPHLVGNSESSLLCLFRELISLQVLQSFEFRQKCISMFEHSNFALLKQYLDLRSDKSRTMLVIVKNLLTSCFQDSQQLSALQISDYILKQLHGSMVDIDIGIREALTVIISCCAVISRKFHFLIEYLVQVFKADISASFSSLATFWSLLCFPSDLSVSNSAEAFLSNSIGSFYETADSPRSGPETTLCISKTGQAVVYFKDYLTNDLEKNKVFCFC
jgi:hypothetical protein